VSGVPAVVQFVHGGLNTFSLPAADPQGDPFTFRLGTAAEADGTYSTPSAGGATLTIDSAGLMSWNTASTTVDQLWTVQAVIEETNNSSTTDVDFFVKIVDGSLNAPPTAVVDNASTDFTLSVGVPFSVDVIGSDRRDHRRWATVHWYVLMDTDLWGYRNLPRGHHQLH
jgi:hypothetical protein